MTVVMKGRAARMERYQVTITETLSSVIEVTAACPLDARDIADEKWRDGECFLDASDFKSVCFDVKCGCGGE